MTLPAFDPVPVTLESEYVKLVPMTIEHAEALYHAGNDERIWRWMVPNRCANLNATIEWINICLHEQSQNRQIPFIIIDKKTNTVVGTTSYLHIFRDHRAMEIGYTFINPSVQRSHVNRSNKLLLLNHAFDELGANRVVLQTHEKNDKSRNAILGLGAQFEGVERYCRILPNNTVRSSAKFSIIRPEWQETKQALINKMAAY